MIVRLNHCKDRRKLATTFFQQSGIRQRLQKLKFVMEHQILENNLNREGFPLKFQSPHGTMSLQNILNSSDAPRDISGFLGSSTGSTINFRYFTNDLQDVMFPQDIPRNVMNQDFLYHPLKLKFLEISRQLAMHPKCFPCSN